MNAFPIQISPKALLSLFLAATISLASGATVSESRSTNVTIPDNGSWAYSPITISEAPAGATVTSIEVSFRCVHPYSGDLEVDLEVGTYSNSKRLWDNEGGAADNPSKTVRTSNFNGLPVNNTWYLYARDTTPLDAGYIDRWEITLTYDAPDPKSDLVVQGTPSVSPNPTAPGQSISVSYRLHNQGPGDAGRSETKIQIKDASGRQVSAPTYSESSLDSGQSRNVQRSLTLPTSLSPGTYTAFVILDNDSDLDQTNTANDLTPGVPFTVQSSQSDIVVIGTPSVVPDPVVPGQSISVGYIITNRGPGEAANSRTKIQIKNASGAQVTAPTFSEGALDPGESEIRQRSVTIPASSSPGSYTAFIILDNDSVLDQTNTNNDLTPGIPFQVAGTQSDIVVEGTPSISPDTATAGQAILIEYRIRNRGSAAAGTSQTKIQIKNESNVQVIAKTFSTPALAPNALTTQQSSITLPKGLPSGPYTAYVILDNQSALDQSNEDNDLTPGVHFAVASGQADLHVEGQPTVSPSAVEAGNNLTISYIIRNSGEVTAGASETKIQIKDARGQELIAPQFSEASLTPGNSQHRSRSIAIPASAERGTYSAFVILDNQSELSQSRESNDISLPVTFAIREPDTGSDGIDLSAHAPIVTSGGTVTPGSTVTMTVRVDNVGTLESPPGHAKLVLLDSRDHIWLEQLVEIPALQAGQSSGSLGAEFWIPEEIAGGAYAFRLIVDTSTVEQSNYGNDYSPKTPVRIQKESDSANGDLIEGIDVSHHQGIIDWQAVRAAGKEFVFIKATEADYGTHPIYFNNNWPEAKSAGLAVGAYHFATPLLSPDFRDPSWTEGPFTAEEEANIFFEAAKETLKPGFLPPVLDLEAHAVSWEPSGNTFVIEPRLKLEYPPNGMPDPLAVMGAKNLADWTIDWCSEVERLSGVRPILYFTKSYANALAPYLADRYDLWIAAISRSPGAPDIPSWGSWSVHQYSWTGSVSGIGGDVDLNVIQGPLSQRLNRAAEILARERAEIGPNSICIELTGSDCQLVPVEVSDNLTDWTHFATVPLVNGFGEVEHNFPSSTQRMYYRIQPAP